MELVVMLMIDSEYSSYDKHRLFTSHEVVVIFFHLLNLHLLDYFCLYLLLNLLRIHQSCASENVVFLLLLLFLE